MVLSRDSLKGLASPPIARGEPLTLAEKEGWTLMSTCDGKLEMNGTPMRMDEIVCLVFSGRSSKSILPSMISILLSAKRGVGPGGRGGPDVNSLIRSW